MPTMILTLAWLLTATTCSVAPSPAGSTSTSSRAELISPAAPASAFTLVSTIDPSEAGWLLSESDNEETDDDDDSGVSQPALTWPDHRAPFGVVGSSSRPTFLARSARRARVLRC